MRQYLPLILMLTLASPALAQGAREAEGSETAAPAERLSPAEIRSSQIDRLFGQLHTASDSETANNAELKIWELWMASDSPTAEVLIQQATKAMNDGAPEQSLGILNRLIGAYPDFAEAWNKRATLYFMMQRFDQSLADIERVLALEPRHFGALSGRGMIYKRQQKYSEAIEAFSQALAINPNMEGPRLELKELEKLEQGI